MQRANAGGARRQPEASPCTATLCPGVRREAPGCPWRGGVATVRSPPLSPQCGMCRARTVPYRLVRLWVCARVEACQAIAVRGTVRRLTAYAAPLRYIVRSKLLANGWSARGTYASRIATAAEPHPAPRDLATACLSLPHLRPRERGVG
jgi:hypothetical protein